MDSQAVTDDEARTEVERTLSNSLGGETFDFVPLIEEARRRNEHRLSQGIDFPTRISIDNKVHPGYTLIQIETSDRLGLLYDLLSCLDQEGVYIAFSRISTEKGAAIDTFYVADASNRGKITDSSRLKELQEKLQQAAFFSD